MKLDRGLIKSQARALIKNKVMKLFLTIFIVSLCSSAVSGISAGVSAFTNMKNWSESYDAEDFGGYYFDDSGDNDLGYYDDFNPDVNQYENDFNSYGDNPAVPAKANTAYSGLGLSVPLSYAASILGILLAPLEVAMAAYFVSFIRGREYELGAGIGYVFDEAFKRNFGKKIAVALLKDIVMSALSVLFLIPGIIFYYSSYFAFEIMCDYPELSPWQAIKLSKKIIQGNRTELFILDLSFIPWGMLCVFVFPIIYVSPYIMTTKALYYENFRLRAIQLGKVTEDDFLSDAQKAAKYSSNQQPFANGYQPQGNNYNDGQPANNYGSPSQNFGANTPNGAQPQQGVPNPAAQAQPYPSAQPTYFTPAVQSPIQPAYYSPEIPKAPDPEQPVDIYTPLTKDTVNPPEDEPVPKITEADVTISEPEEPSSPELIEPQEPTDAFTEPEEAPAEASEPKPLTDDGSDVDL